MSCTTIVSAVDPERFASIWIDPANVASTFTAAAAEAGSIIGFPGDVINAPVPSAWNTPYANSGVAVGTNVVASPRDSMYAWNTDVRFVLFSVQAVAALVARIVPPASVGVPVWWRISIVKFPGVATVVH